MLLYSFARASYSSGDIGRSFMTAAADHLTQAQGPLDPPAIGTAMWAFARLGYHPGARCMERLTRCTLDEAALSQFTVQGLCTMLWSTAELASPLPPPRLRRVSRACSAMRNQLAVGGFRSLWICSFFVDLIRYGWCCGRRLFQARLARGLLLKGSGSKMNG